MPYTKTELKFLALPDIIHDYQVLAVENMPENPLKFLYPDTPQNEAFGPFYSERREGTVACQIFLCLSHELFYDVLFSCIGTGL